ncbi:sugar ABC transporter substrate-binding protein [Clostridiales bacterium BAD-6]|uniref:Sugar ABC transporter substrate-binding protein n=2 Tax=Sinanaerobacter chloroacetimidivorans TaxID=2818044 RepID=A0A8J8B4A3_9FIRM|nr:sugar ABC transporter substrate-binding protein [Sinanaerobacter chloroacetimidivorans]
MIAVLSGCAGEGTGTTDDESEAPTKFALFMTHMSNAFTIELSDAVKAQAEELGVELTVNDAGQDVAKQISQIETAVNQGVDGIIIEPVSVDGIIPAVQMAKEAGVTVVIVNQQISDPSAADAYVGVSNADGGEMEMTKAAEDIGGEGNVAFLLGPMGSDAQIGRSEGYQRVLDKNAGINKVFESTAEWDTAKALSLVENWLQAGKNIKAIVAQNDGMALGALKAVEDANLQDSIKIYGLDATPDALAAVKEGRLTATVSQSTTAQGTEAMKACYAIANGETVDSEILVDFTLITKDNVDDFL